MFQPPRLLGLLVASVAAALILIGLNTRADAQGVNTRTAGVFVRADPTHAGILDGGDNRKRAGLIAERLRCWKSTKGT